MRLALARHDELIESLVAQQQGVLVRPRGEGDSRFAVFARATDAVAAAAAIQQALHAEPWPVKIPVRVRMALHTGEADLRDGDYYGSAVNRAARLRAIGHGGQTLLSTATQALVRDGLPAGVTLRDAGEHRLSDLARPELPTYAAFRVPEVWRYDGARWHVLLLADDAYAAAAESRALPGATATAIATLLDQSPLSDDVEWMGKVRQWARTLRRPHAP